MRKIRGKVIILTGPSGAGKTSLARHLEKKGFIRLDGDRLARQLYAPGRPLWRAIRGLFGAGILRRDGRIDRLKVGELVFKNPAVLRRLNRLVFPSLVRAFRLRLRRLGCYRRACLDMAVYFQAGAPHFCAGRVVLVEAPLKRRIGFLLAKGLPSSRARAQARALHFTSQERRSCDLVLRNTGSLDQLKSRLDAWLDSLKGTAYPARRVGGGGVRCQ